MPDIYKTAVRMMPWAEEILQAFLTNLGGQIFTDFWHNLYIRRLPGPSPRPLEDFQPTFSEVFQYVRGKNLPAKNLK